MATVSVKIPPPRPPEVTLVLTWDEAVYLRKLLGEHCGGPSYGIYVPLNTSLEINGSFE
jgi:hypothetical protein